MNTLLTLSLFILATSPSVLYTQQGQGHIAGKILSLYLTDSLHMMVLLVAFSAIAVVAYQLITQAT